MSHPPAASPDDAATSADQPDTPQGWHYGQSYSPYNPQPSMVAPGSARPHFDPANNGLFQPFGTPIQHSAAQSTFEEASPNQHQMPSYTARPTTSKNLVATRTRSTAHKASYPLCTPNNLIRNLLIRSRSLIIQHNLDYIQPRNHCIRRSTSRPQQRNFHPPRSVHMQLHRCKWHMTSIWSYYKNWRRSKPRT